MPGSGDRFSNQDRLIDLFVVVVVLALFLLQFTSNIFGDYGKQVTEPDLFGVVLVLVTTLPLYWRRANPWMAMAFAGAGNIALVGFGYLVHVPVALLVALYTFGARPSGRVWPPIAFASLLFGTQVVVEYTVISLSLEDYVIPALLLVVAWVLGERRNTISQRRANERERRQREEELSIAKERTRIARELHDSAGHAINTILVQAGAARVLRERDPEQSQAAIESIERLARETIEDIDRIVGSLRADGPAELAPLPGLDAIPSLVERQREAGFAVELRTSEEGSRQPPAAVGRAAYRIAQESLTNAARHGVGSSELTIRRLPDRLELTVTNPIHAFVPAQRDGGGLGLVGMRERAQLLGGSLRAGPEAGEFRVLAVLPYDQRAE